MHYSLAGNSFWKIYVQSWDDLTAIYQGGNHQNFKKQTQAGLYANMEYGPSTGAVTSKLIKMRMIPCSECITNVNPERPKMMKIGKVAHGICTS